MNRLLSLTDVAESLSLDVEAESWSGMRAFDTDARTINYTEVPHAVVAPIHYESGYSYPLVVWLHSRGSNESELCQIMPEISQRNYVGIAPRGVAPSTATETLDGEQAAEWRQTVDDVSASEQRVLDCIDIARSQFNISPQRVFLAGFGSGGTMALRIAFCNPERFAGVISISGYLPTGDRPLRQIDDLRQLPVLLVATHPNQDYDESRMCRDLRLLHSVGCDVDLRQYLCEHDITTDMLADLNHWMMQRVCAA